MADHPIQGLMKTAMENLKKMIDVNTIVGDPVQAPDGQIIIPISKVGFGFGAGGTEFSGFKITSEANDKKHPHKEATNPSHSGEDRKFPFGGGSGGGISISPVGFIVVSENNMRFLSVESKSMLMDRILDLIPKITEKFSKKEEMDEAAGNEPENL